jgi:S1-C subfamily serine protease
MSSLPVEPHQAALMQSKSLPSRIYVTGRAKGSPAYMYQLTPTNWITHINGNAVATLDDFIAAVKGLPDNEYVRLKVLSFDHIPFVLSIKLNKHYWPATEVLR